MSLLQRGGAAFGRAVALVLSFTPEHVSRQGAPADPPPVEQIDVTAEGAKFGKTGVGDFQVHPLEPLSARLSLTLMF
jgi:hypothetical protein